LYNKECNTMKKLSVVTAALVVIGGLNWGLVAIAEFDLVAWIFGVDFGETNAATRIVYGLVGVAAVYQAALLAGVARRPRRAPLVTSIVVAALLVPAGLAAAATDVSAPAKQSTSQRNLVQTAVAAGDFKTLVSLVKRAGLTHALSGDRKLTVFAPTDAAFKKVPEATLSKLLADRAALRRVLLYHVVAGNVKASKVVGLSSAKTLAGPKVAIAVRGGRVYLNKTTRVVKTDVAASNGTIHVINRVLIPPSS
jgi:uncharacterized surface protein with fasciclin (FAS1) repeats/uncharacterized membrane protein YuzA (DUF378 family)